MLEHHFLDMAAQAQSVRHAELLARAENERRCAAGSVRPARWRRRVLAGLGARLIAMGQQLERAGDSHAAPIRIEV